MQILRDFVVFAGTSRMFVSSPTTSSLGLKSIRQPLIEGTINTVNKVCAITRAIGSDRFNELCWYARQCNEQHFYARNQTNVIQTQWFFKLREEIVWPFTFFFKK